MLNNANVDMNKIMFSVLPQIVILIKNYMRVSGMGHNDV